MNQAEVRQVLIVLTALALIFIVLGVFLFLFALLGWSTSFITHDDAKALTVLAGSIGFTGTVVITGLSLRR